MDADDLLPLKAKPGKPDLMVMGIAEIHEYIAGLRSEIARAEAVIAEKQAQRAAADSFSRSQRNKARAETGHPPPDRHPAAGVRF